jgi:hypothetical protein
MSFNELSPPNLWYQFMLSITWRHFAEDVNFSDNIYLHFQKFIEEHENLNQS